MTSTYLARPLRTYVDTSVFGGCFDPQFEVPSRRFFAEVSQGRFIILVSEVTAGELRRAPPWVQEVYEKVDPNWIQEVPIDQAVLDLVTAYISAKIVTRRAEVDATHVAAASVAGADLLVSWNFRDLVHVDKIRGFQSVNIARGFSSLDIRSPWEVLHEEGD